MNIIEKKNMNMSQSKYPAVDCQLQKATYDIIDIIENFYNIMDEFEFSK